MEGLATTPASYSTQAQDVRSYAKNRGNCSIT